MIKENIDKLERLYKEFIEPSNFIKNFKNEKQFRNWLQSGTKEDCLCALEEFEADELYEICIIIKDHLDNI